MQNAPNIRPKAQCLLSMLLTRAGIYSNEQCTVFEVQEQAHREAENIFWETM